MSSDKLANIHQPMATVDFEITSNQPGKPDLASSLEMNNNELDMLITKLEEAAQVLTL